VKSREAGGPWLALKTLADLGAEAKAAIPTVRALAENRDATTRRSAIETLRKIDPTAQGK
jgi:hypothetical protein